MREITTDEANRSSGGFPVWLDVIGPDNKPTGEKLHHLTKQRAVVATYGQVLEDTTKRGRGRSHPDQNIVVGRRE
ncbi:MAG: hypothetical protein RLZZ360_391 [Candidatus Parcubacteria bacterium]|jgi:hypothetical protein